MHAQQRARRAGAEAARRRIHVRRDSRERGLDAVPRDGEVAHEVRVDQRHDGAGQDESRAQRRIRARAKAASAASTAPIGSSTPTASTVPGAA